MKKTIMRDGMLSGARALLHASALLLTLGISGCTVTTTTPGGTGPSTPQTVHEYFAPTMASSLNRATFSIDHANNNFVQYFYLANAGNEQYVANSGTFTALASGMLNIGVTFGGGTGLQGTLYTPAQTGNWAMEFPGEVALAGMLNQSVVPLAYNQSCPDYSKGQNFEFITLPNAGDQSGAAYGTFNMTTSGTTVSFGSISQLNIAGAAASNPSAATMSGTCSPTFFGRTISVPDTSTVTNPGNGQTTTPSATIAVAPSGVFVEDNGANTNAGAYQNILGAGTGAIGLPVPSAAVSTSALTGAHFAGFIFGTGAAAIRVKNLPAVPTSTRVASFGYPDLQTACATPPIPQSSTVIYGGEFSGNDPASHAYGNCDIAIDLGVQDTKTAGLYPAATVWLGPGFPGNTTGRTYSFPAVAVTGQINNKYAVFLVGLDTTGLQVTSQGQQSQDWGIYLLQSN